MIKLQAHIDILFIVPIWKLLIDAKCNYIGVELRDAKKREVSFASVNLNTGKLNFSELQVTEKWLTGLQGTYNGVIFLHGYQSAQSPVHQGVIAIDAETGTILWSDYSSNLNHMSANGPIMYNKQIQPQKLVLLDAQTGLGIRNYDTLIDEPIEPDIKLPALLPYLPQEFVTFINRDTTGNIHYLEHNDFRIVSLHSVNNGLLQQFILVTQRGNLVFEDLLNDKIQKLQPEAFMVHGNRLIYIKDTTSLIVLNL